MYGFNESDAWSKLIGKKLIQVCFGEHETICVFDSQIELTIESVFDVWFNNQPVPKEGNAQVLHLVESVNCIVHNVIIYSKSTMLIAFSNTLELRLYDTDTRFESVQLSGPNIQIIV
jgi:hypothetical protein